MTNSVKMKAFAKVNLVLDVGAKDAQNYHPLITVMHSIGLFDLVEISKIDNNEISTKMKCGYCAKDSNFFAVSQISSDNNIATKAAIEFFKEFNVQNSGLEIKITKKIPFQAGMGGGSSDAAAVLKGCAELFGYDIKETSTLIKLEKIGSLLGSDVNFFFHMPCALMQHYGETFVKNLQPLNNTIIIIKPNIGLSTAEMYKILDKHNNFLPLDVSRYSAYNSARNIFFSNSFEKPARKLNKEIDNILFRLESVLGYGKFLLCGSGSSCFGVCSEKDLETLLAKEFSDISYFVEITKFQ